MAKNIVVLSDGTGQEGGKAAALNTNVYRIFNMIENRTPRQVVFYDAGLGTGWRKVTGNIGGAGFSTNLKEGYRFILDHYEIGDRIYLIGFSRGAATVRSLAGFIDLFGILPKARPELIEAAYKIYKTPGPISESIAQREIDLHELEDPEKLAEYLYPGDFEKVLYDYGEAVGRITGYVIDSAPDDAAAKCLGDTITGSSFYYEGIMDGLERDAREILANRDRDPDKNPRKFMRAVELKKRALNFLAANHSQPAPIEFMGCFDSVAALGVPSPAVNAFFNQFSWFAHKFHNFSLGKSVRHAYHALAIDDLRKPFKPEPWVLPEEKIPGQTLHQVWFTGMHTDVGGGYPHRGLSDITLAWMVRNAHKHGLLLDAGHDDPILEDFTDVMHDSRGTFTTRLIYQPETPRCLDGFPPEKPVIHETVLLRAKAPEIREWNADAEETAEGKAPVVTVPGNSYEPWIVNGEVDNKNEDFEVEKWVPFNREELLAAQENTGADQGSQAGQAN